MFNVDISDATTAWVVRCKGEIDLATAPVLHTALESVAPGTDRDLVVDLAEVTFIDSSGLQALIDAHKRVGASGQRVSVQGCSPVAKRLFEICQVDRLMEIH